MSLCKWCMLPDRRCPVWYPGKMTVRCVEFRYDRD